jgi:glutamine synthetase
MASCLNPLSHLSQQGKVQAEYVWIGGGKTTGGFDLRCKTKTLNAKPSSVADLPVWNYDGSSTNQAPGEDSEVLLRPVAIFADPFRGGDNILVLCDTMDPKKVPIPTNTRASAAKMFAEKPDEVPWFGIEQEYTLFEKDSTTPLGWPKGGYPGPQGPYYCSAGTDVSFGRSVMEAHYSACLYAGVTIAGINAEVMPGQWEYQIGPCRGVEIGDHMAMARYIMLRVTEKHGCVVSFEPKPMDGDWNGAGCHTNFSIKTMRAAGGFEVIKQVCEAFGKVTAEHIAEYGEGNEKRLTGEHETCSIKEFKYDVANRGASIRIPRSAEKTGKGYMEDRRPAANCDAYRVASRILKTTGECLSEPAAAPAAA